MSLAKQHHEAMVSKGFWEEPNLLEKKMLIISELGEAIEAHRKGRVCELNEGERTGLGTQELFSKETFIADFEKFVKDTYEDELADVVLRIWDYMEYTGQNGTGKAIKLKENVGENLYKITEAICKNQFIPAINAISVLCPNLDWHIKMKMAFNKTRPHKHGKSY